MQSMRTKPKDAKNADPLSFRSSGRCCAEYYILLPIPDRSLKRLNSADECSEISEKIVVSHHPNPATVGRIAFERS